MLGTCFFVREVIYGYYRSFFIKYVGKSSIYMIKKVVKSLEFIKILCIFEEIYLF